jgi:hypothetical protein
MRAADATMSAPESIRSAVRVTVLTRARTTKIAAIVLRHARPDNNAVGAVVEIFKMIVGFVEIAQLAARALPFARAVFAFQGASQVSCSVVARVSIRAMTHSIAMVVGTCVRWVRFVAAVFAPPTSVRFRKQYFALKMVYVSTQPQHLPHVAGAESFVRLGFAFKDSAVATSTPTAHRHSHAKVVFVWCRRAHPGSRFALCKETASISPTTMAAAERAPDRARPDMNALPDRARATPINSAHLDKSALATSASFTSKRLFHNTYITGNGWLF